MILFKRIVRLRQLMGTKFLFHIVHYTGLDKLSTLAENPGQNIRGQAVLAKLSVAKLSGHQ